MEVEYKADSGITIKSAVVKYSNMLERDCTKMTVAGEVIERFTTPDNTFHFGVADVMQINN